LGVGLLGLAFGWGASDFFGLGIFEYDVCLECTGRCANVRYFRWGSGGLCDKMSPRFLQALLLQIASASPQLGDLHSTDVPLARDEFIV
jgi:hypothetical protein